MGFFVSYNSAGRGKVSARTILFEKFLDRYFPHVPPTPEKIENAKADAAAIAGFYKSSRRFESSFLKLLTLLGRAKVVANADGTIGIDPLKGPNGELRKFEEIGPFLYREVHGEDLLGFKKDSAGQWQFQIEIPVFIFQKVGSLENKYLNLGILIFGLGMVLLTVVFWPVGALIRKHYGHPLELAPADRRMRLIVRLVCVLFLLVSIGWVAALSATDEISAFNKLPPWVAVFGIGGVLCVIGTVLVVMNAVKSCRVPGRWFWSKLHDVALALGCLGLVWFLIAWKLMNFNLNF